MGFMTTLFLKVLLILGIYAILVTFFHRVTSKRLGVKRRSFFSSETVNDHHERGDKLLSYLTLLVLLAGFIFHVVTDFDSEYWFFQPYFIVAIFYVARNLWKSFVENKVFSDKRESIYTMMETGMNTLLFTALFTSGFWFF
ncbi:DUF4181 domain-containing protein [Rossellomorea vietnamensis]|uniref:DUF4181 domain-containing protein n=1 Tax=Rossellomorea vietnamensis TaxID=218284 RepID=UPI001E564AAA|nr:DUF4181 domain-containing protein [Rossellomorea vietnamensis]MCC5800898.1 DUF4181 domain-containing protein [Rossellomorea vietnamensis]